MLDVYEFYITPFEYDFALKKGISQQTLNSRIRALGWNKENAINISPKKYKRLDKKYINLAKQNGIPYTTFVHRVNVLGWTQVEASTKPKKDMKAHAKKMHEKKRKWSKEMKALAIKNGISSMTFYRRCNKGWNEYDAATIPTKV